MLVKKRNYSRSTSIVLSLFIHVCIIIALCYTLIEKKHAQPLFLPPEPDVKNKSEKKPPSSPLDSQTFVVPAPVVYYGNQTMMNLPIPIKGSATGASGFDQKSTSLPTPLVQKTTEKQLFPSNTPVPQEATTAFDEQAPIVETVQEQTLGSSFVSFKEKNTETPGPAQKKLTLADMFKNAQSEISQLANEGQTSATKAGTENGDINGSGHQITIKEGDMRYYILWAKFLNHLNQAAHFSRRGKEQLIYQWIQQGEIEYILHCSITVDIEGNVISVEINHSSGCKKFDELCIANVYSAVPFPPLPASLGKKTAKFEVSVFP